MNNNEIADKFKAEFGIEINSDRITFTRDTIEEFIKANENYLRPGEVEILEQKKLKLKKAIATFRSPVFNVYVLDIGEKRALYLEKTYIG
jgi:hypothetical protein